MTINGIEIKADSCHNYEQHNWDHNAYHIHLINDCIFYNIELNKIGFRIAIIFLTI